MQKIIIDGYNVIHADEGLKKTAARELETAREALIVMIRRYLGSKKMQVTLVFDGAGGLTDAEPVVPGRLQVLFTSAGQTADELILRTLSRSKNAREYIVVTSDMADIGRSARGMGAKLLGSREFLKRIKGKASGWAGNNGEEDEKERVGDAEDLDYWMNKFGEHPADEE